MDNFRVLVSEDKNHFYLFEKVNLLNNTIISKNITQNKNVKKITLVIYWSLEFI